MSELDVRTSVPSAMEQEIDREWKRQKKQARTPMGRSKKVMSNRYEPLPIDDLKEYGKYKRNWKPSAPSVPKGYYMRRRSMKGKGPSQLTFVSEEPRRYHMRKPKIGIGPSQLVFVSEPTKKKKKNV